MGDRRRRGIEMGHRVIRRLDAKRLDKPLRERIGAVATQEWIGTSPLTSTSAISAGISMRMQDSCSPTPGADHASGSGILDAGSSLDWTAGRPPWAASGCRFLPPEGSWRHPPKPCRDGDSQKSLDLPTVGSLTMAVSFQHAPFAGCWLSDISRCLRLLRCCAFCGSL